MCGIVGILSKKGENVVPLIGSMLSCMINRGPDGAGIAANRHVVPVGLLFGFKIS